MVLRRFHLVISALAVAASAWAEEFCGEERIEALLATLAGKPPSEACERTIEVTGEYQQGSQFDDIVSSESRL